MFNSLDHALKFAFMNYHRAVSSENNTAKVLRMAQQGGYVAGHVELTGFDIKVQCRMVIESVDRLLAGVERAAIVCYYHDYNTPYADGAIELARYFDHVHSDLILVDKVINHIYLGNESINAIAKDREVDQSNLNKLKKRMAKQLNEIFKRAYFILEADFIERDIVPRNAA